MGKRSLLLIIFHFFYLSFSQGITIQDKFTSETFTYTKVSVWDDGSVMNDSKVDNIIYIKKDGNYFRRNYLVLNALWFGAMPNDNLDDSKALQKAIDFAVKSSQNLKVPFGRYYIDNSIILPQHFHYSVRNIDFDFSNSVLILRKDISLFTSSNWKSKLDSNYTNGLSVGNFEIVSEIGNLNNYAIQIQDFHQGTKLYNISSIHTKNFLHSINSYYLELYNINTMLSGSGGERFYFEGYHGLNKFSKLLAGNSNVCYKFSGGMVAALDMQNISIEGCKTGILFESEVYNLSLKSSYFENFDLALEFKNYIHSANIADNYFNFLNKKSSYLLKYKGLPKNNIFFNGGNTYVGTDFTTFFKDSEDTYGQDIIIEMPSVDNALLNRLNATKGKNIKVLRSGETTK